MSCWKCGAAVDRHESSKIPIDLTRLLSTNDPPLDADRSLIRDLFIKDSLRVDALNIHIGMLIAERDVITDRLQKYPVVLATVRRVPPELIGEIFSWVLPGEKRASGAVVERPPWHLGHISRSWSDIARGLPTLWSSIDVYHSRHFPHFPHTNASPLAMVETQLTRSANAPLYINFRWWIDEDEAVPFLGALLPHSDRWKSLHFECEGRSYTSLLELFQPAKGRLAQLEALEFKIIEGPHNFPPSDIFALAPRLGKTILTDPKLYHASPPLSIPWDQLTHYRGVVPLKQFSDILQTAFNLVEGVVGILGDPSNQTIGTVVTLPRLRRLYIEQVERLPNFTAPNLEYLSCINLEAILRFVDRSACQLTTLVLVEAPPEEIISLLRSTPSLSRLVLESATSSAANIRILNAMTVTGSPDDLCLNLTYLACGFMEYSGASNNVFLATIRSRLRSERGCQLSCLRLMPALSNAGSGAMEVAQILRDEGVDVILVDDSPAFMDNARYLFVLG
ncbi:hypothetical protein DFH06DRAFT_1480655 [Mycena polygramma]|nr:hypothetical protein DFH06DRAFT_1480655 [Mycena polygramma]